MNPKQWMVLSAVALRPALGLADNGYFQIGYGAEARGVAGAAAASTRDAFGGASNPATTVWAGNSFEGNLIATNGRTSMSRAAGLPPPLSGVLDTHTASASRWVPLADIAVSKMVTSDLSLSVVGYSNGAGTYFPDGTTTCLAPPPAGAGTTYRGNLLCGSGRATTTIQQLTIAPTVSARVSPSFSVGFSVLLTGQLFSAEGLQALAPQSAAPDHLTNQGSASSFGVGMRIGAYWRASDVLAFGAAYSPRIRMGRLKEYEGLLADQGRLDIPENMLLGLQWSPTQAVSFLFDYQRINYSGTSGLGNPSFDGTALRGSSGGPGNGWKDMNVFKLGVRYQVTPALNISGGVSFNSAAYADEDTANNVTAPATFRRHYTLGLGYATGPNSKWSVFYSLSPGHTTTGSSAMASAVATQLAGSPTVAGQESLATRQQSIGVQYSQRF
ncbi:OmpP1/FadL family transporter [Cupriavidus sp. CP313]